MTPLSLHCTRCAFITTTTQDGMKHVRENPDHTVIGPGAAEGTTITITLEKD